MTSTLEPPSQYSVQEWQDRWVNTMADSGVTLDIKSVYWWTWSLSAVMTCIRSAVYKRCREETQGKSPMDPRTGFTLSLSSLNPVFTIIVCSFKNDLSHFTDRPINPHDVLRHITSIPWSTMSTFMLALRRASSVTRPELIALLESSHKRTVFIEYRSPS